MWECRGIIDRVSGLRGLGFGVWGLGFGVESFEGI